MRPQARRKELAMRGDLRLSDAATFARLSRARGSGACYRERLPLDNAAREACLSPFHFNRVFARAFGETQSGPNDFRIDERIDYDKDFPFLEGSAKYTEPLVLGPSHLMIMCAFT
jgi:hypothetical protein